VPVSVSKGYDPGYFLKSAAAGKENYYTSAAGSGMEPAGTWAGRGLAALGLIAGAIVDPDTLRNLFTKRIHPQTGEVLGRSPHTFKKLDDEIEDLVDALMLDEPAHMQTPERRRELTFMVRVDAGREHVNFYDVGFSVPKSVSLLQVGWTAAAAEARAAGDTARAAECDAKAGELEQAVMASARSIVRMAEKHVYLRTGHHSATTGDYKRPAGLSAAIFMHHTSRTAAGEAAGDPQLHAHIAFWAYAQRADGADDIYRSIDAQGLYEWKSYYAAVAELELEQRVQQLGYAIVRTDSGDFEVGGLHHPKVLRQFSTRTAEITKELAPQVKAFIERNGHAPSRAVLRAMSKNATYKTRQPKDHAPDRAQQLAVWDAKYRAATLQALTEIPETAAEYAQRAAVNPPLSAAQRVQCIAVAMATLQMQRATWTAPHLALEIRKTLPVLDDSVVDDDVDALVLSMVREALAGDGVVLLKPPAAVEMPADGVAPGDPPPCTKPADFSRYATLDHLLTEGRLLDDAVRPAPPVLTPRAAARAIGSTPDRIRAERGRQGSDEGAGEDPRPLSADGLTNDQALALYGLLTSGRTVNVLVGAAGTGKSHVVSRLARIIRDETGGRVIGVTAAENAARVLIAEGLDDAHNIAHFLGYLEGTEERRGHLPLGAGDWLVVDEAGTVDTRTLAELGEVVKARGARMLLTGDPEQLGSVEAGGAMRLIAEEHGYFEIHEVKRFAEAWEGPASLRIRAGDAAAVREYIERGRVLEGAEDEVTAQLVKQYTGSLVAGRNALLITDANAGAEKLAGLVRDQLIRLGEVKDPHNGVPLADGNEASRGDLVRATRNSKSVGGERKLANRDVLQIDAVGETHATVRRLTGISAGERQYGPAFKVPRAYLEKHSALAYGGNIFVGQGRTVDDSYQLLTDGTSRESFYVAMTRGRARNVAGVVTERHTDDPVLPNAPPPQKVTAEALLSKAVTRQRDDLTATEYLREQQDAEYSMASLVGRWQVLTRAASTDAYDAVLHETLPAEAYERVRSDPERGSLTRHLRAAEMAGQDSKEILRQAVAQRDLSSARSVAAVLHGRVARIAGPVSQKALDSYTAATPDLPDPQADAAAKELARLADARSAELGQQAAATRPVWALHGLGEPPAEPAARQEWTDRAAKVASYRELSSYKDPVEPVGPAPMAGAVELRSAWRAAADAIGMDEWDQGIRETPEMQLLAEDQAAQRAKVQEPADVAQERQDSELAKGGAVAEARLSEAAAANASEQEAEAARKQADSAAQLAYELSVRTAWLAERDEARREWHAAKEAKLARGAQAREELNRRIEAGELVDEYDIVKAYLTLKEPAQDAPAADVPEMAEPEPVEAERFQQVAAHREQAVEHVGRAELEAAQQAQARVDQQRAAQEAEAEAARLAQAAAAQAQAGAGYEIEAE
jgi:conjugative relaxase-like TrwC/TraI family protein